MFDNPKAKAVLQHYLAREQADEKKMKELGADGFARRDEFLLPIGEDVGRFLHSLILAKKPKRILEVGTSYGYSTLFFADAAAQVGAIVITLEIAENKLRYAKEKIAEADLSHVVDFRLGDAIELIKQDDGPFDLVLLDIWKELYIPALEAVYPKLAEEGIIAADNMYIPSIHLDMARNYRARLEQKDDLQTSLLPIGSGIELSCRWARGNPKL